MSERNPSLHILQHALGMDDYGRQPDGDYRNHYVADENCDGWDLCMAHVEAGRMKRRGPHELYGGGDSYCFVVTDAGRAFVREQSPRPPKLSRAKRRYDQFLEADSGLTFGEWLQAKRYRYG